MFVKKSYLKRKGVLCIKNLCGLYLRVSTEDQAREDYWKFSKDLYTHNIFSDKTIQSIQDDYIWNKENDKNKDKGKDDYEMEI